MDTEDEYSLAEAADRLGWAVTTLRDRCTQHAVPHHRRHATRGIYLTEDDITAIRGTMARPLTRGGPRGARQRAAGTLHGDKTVETVAAAAVALLPARDRKPRRLPG
jgi:hypothetical protein